MSHTHHGAGISSIPIDLSIFYGKCTSFMEPRKLKV